MISFVKGHQSSSYLFKGDVIVKVNDIDVSDLNSKKVRELLNAIPPGGVIVLLVQGPEGYTTYLHTGKYIKILITFVKLKFLNEEKYELVD